jgi:hypothetical protein
MLNHLQILVHLPALAAELPPKYYPVMEEIFNIATFDIPYFDFSYLPESLW